MGEGARWLATLCRISDHVDVSVQVQSLWEEVGSKPATKSPAHVAFLGHTVAFSIYFSLDFGGSIAL